MDHQDTTQAAADDALLAALNEPASPYTVEGVERDETGRPTRWGVASKGRIIATIPDAGAVGRIEAQQIAASLNAGTLAPQYGGPVTEIPEGKLVLRGFTGEDFQVTAVFTDRAAANAYMAAHPDEALIATAGDVALIAKVEPEPRA